ncbi:hypothetical protein F4808DRAFT_464811 [Astrocystis sublimbata]|nr:hypothetical protein F4808DRAFT_464811 [Astrocystis sublimbata]
MFRRDGVKDSTPNNITFSAAQDRDSPTAKRRKVRKGTRSCWECKRRKVKCVFEGDCDVCLGCQRRRTPCVAQELPEDLAPASIGSRHLSHRISRVEDLVNGFLASQAVSPASPSLRPLPTLLENVEYSSPDPSSYGATLDTTQIAPASSQSDRAIAQHLLAAFPSERDTKLLLRESTQSSRYTLMVNVQSHYKLTCEALTTPCSHIEPPSPSTHPIIVARLMLLFAITLQSPSREKLSEISEPLDELMQRLVNSATTWVTTQEAMHDTIDGLICIMLEGVYQINCGNLKRAWLVYRRAMAVAQLMGLQRSHPPPVKRIDPMLEVKPHFLWFRIVYMDRYLSLMLGNPQGTTSIDATSSPTPEQDSPLSTFDRRLTVIASRILERNEHPFSAREIPKTQAIDSELLQASRGMPLSFWRPANFQGLAPGSPETLLETIRIGAQVYYYGLLVQLHLPYTLRLQDNVVNNNSKTTCINSSREIILRFITHRTFNPLSCCSRPVDFFALLAGIALLLAHLDTYNHPEIGNPLAHQRLSDRALLIQAQEMMDVISKANKDVITGKSAQVLRRLLDIEAKAAEGKSYTTENAAGSDGTQNEIDERDDSLSLHIPYIGVIKIARQGPITPEVQPADQSKVELTACGRDPLYTNSLSFPTMSAIDDESSGNLVAARPSLSEALPPPEHNLFSRSFSAPNQTSAPCPHIPEQSNLNIQSHLQCPSQMAGSDSWGFQGVDTTFFEGLMQGLSSDDKINLV